MSFVVFLSLISGCEKEGQVVVCACEVWDLEAMPGACAADDTYQLTLDFRYENPGNDFFEVFVRNDERIGTYKLSDLPLTIEDFERSGSDYDFIKVCINDRPGCCEAVEFRPPECREESCEVRDLTVDPGECVTENTYDLTLDFIYENPGNDFFEVFVRNDERIGYYKLSDLPLKIEGFERSGSDYDFIKVCINDRPGCCKAVEFEPPGCE